MLDCVLGDTGNTWKFARITLQPPHSPRLLLCLTQPHAQYRLQTLQCFFFLFLFFYIGETLCRFVNCFWNLFGAHCYLSLAANLSPLIQWYRWPFHYPLIVVCSILYPSWIHILKRGEWTIAHISTWCCCVTDKFKWMIFHLHIILVQQYLSYPPAPLSIQFFLFPPSPGISLSLSFLLLLPDCIWCTHFTAFQFVKRGCKIFVSLYNFYPVNLTLDKGSVRNVWVFHSHSNFTVPFQSFHTCVCGGRGMTMLTGKKDIELKIWVCMSILISANTLNSVLKSLCCFR